MRPSNPFSRRGRSVSDGEHPGKLRRVVSRRMLFFFILGDILGGGIYALVGEVGSEVGGAIWASFLVALLLAALTAGSYAELVTKYPRAGGAALYAKEAFGSPLAAFLVAFAVMASGVTSASALARAFGGDYLAEFIAVPVAVAALVFIAVVAVINMIMASRLLYGMAKEDVLLSSFGRLSKRKTPLVAIAFTTLIAAGLILTGDLGALADTTVLLLLGVFIAVNLSALSVRLMNPG